MSLRVFAASAAHPDPGSESARSRPPVRLRAERHRRELLNCLWHAIQARQQRLRVVTEDVVAPSEIERICATAIVVECRLPDLNANLPGWIGTTLGGEIYTAALQGGCSLTVAPAIAAEIHACQRLLQEARALLLEQDASISGFNVGINSGTAAGQTVMHSHIHLIPRRTADSANPTWRHSRGYFR